MSSSVTAGPSHTSNPVAAASGAGPVVAPPVNRIYRFLKSGTVAYGPRTLNVDQVLLLRADDEVSTHAGKSSRWAVRQPTSEKRRVYHRLNRVNNNINPLASETPNEACHNCTKYRHLCIIVRIKNEPVIVPLPAQFRVGAAPSSLDYYIRAAGTPVP